MDFIINVIWKGETMTFTWITGMTSNKGLILLSGATASPTLFPDIFGSVDTLMINGTAMGIVILLSIWEYLTSPKAVGTFKQKKHQKKKERSELFSKVVTYLLIFIAFIFLQRWAEFEQKEYLSYVTDFLVIGLYIISVFGELIFIGNNQQEKYGKKHPFFGFIQKLNDVFQKLIIEKISGKSCGLDEK